VKKNEHAHDVKYIAQLCQGDRGAFTFLFNKYSPPLLQVARRLGLDRFEAEEIVQEVFTKVWVHRARLNPELSFIAYIIKIARNTIFNRTKRKLYEAAYFKYKHHLHDQYGYTTENQIFLRELQQVLEDKLLQLPEKRQMVYRMSREEGLSNSAIAAKLGISESTVENHINSALKVLKSHLKSRHFLPVFLLLLSLP
jgi:RNA polymerase sigma-70 factor (ECF subfamily)